MRVVDGQVLRVDAVPAASSEDDIHHAVLAVDDHSAFFGDVHQGVLRVSVVGQEDLGPPGALDVHVHHTQEDPREALVEDPWFHLVFRSYRHCAEGDLAERLVGVRHCHDQDVRGRPERHHAQHRHWSEHSIDADTAGLQRHGLTVAGQSPESHQEPDEDRHRDGDAECLRNERQHELGDRPAADTLREQLLDHGHDRVDHEDEGEDQKTEKHHPECFPQDVAVNDAQHRRWWNSITTSIGQRMGKGYPARASQALGLVSDRPSLGPAAVETSSAGVTQRGYDLRRAQNRSLRFRHSVQIGPDL